MKSIDLNADIGEADTPGWAQSERDILNYVSSVNIACGAHAGSHETMRTTLKNAKAHTIVIGAHPSYPDRANFGRRSMTLGQDISVEVLRKSLTQQIKDLIEIAIEEGTRVSYVKPHGALYNDAVAKIETATLIAEVIYGIDPNLMFMGAPDSAMSAAAKTHDLSFIAEGFIDRRYTDDGHLQSRSIDGAIIKKQEERLGQALSLALDHTVKTASGNRLIMTAASLCLHGDSAGAVETARDVRRALEKAGLTIKGVGNGNPPNTHPNAHKDTHPSAQKGNIV